MTPPEYQWIDSQDDFERLRTQLGRESELAVDTEADGFHHYFDKLCLLQFSTTELNVVVDPLAIGSLQALAPVLSDAGITKVLHAAEQDLMYLARDHGLKLNGLFAPNPKIARRVNQGLGKMMHPNTIHQHARR